MSLSALVLSVGTTLAGPAPADAAGACAPVPQPTIPEGLPYRTDFGTPQHLDCTTSDGGPIEFGDLAEPPATSRAVDTGIDVIAHWYQGFGLEATLTSGKWSGWYDWSWNAASNAATPGSRYGYDPARQPLLGNYRGDDPRVLGWIAHWLATGGVRAVAFTDTAGFTTDVWDRSSSSWVVEYFDNTPNAAALDYVLPIGTKGDPAEIRRRAAQLVEFYASRPGAYVERRIDGQRYAVVNAWDLEMLRGSFDSYNGSKRTEAFLVGLASWFRSTGKFDGVTVLGRNGGVLASSAATRLRDQHVNVHFATYEGKYASSATDYPSYVASTDYDAIASRRNTVLGVFTSLDTAYPHPSKYAITGATPELFARQVRAAREAIVRNDLPRMLTVYNVSEWAEGGPGLVPNAQDGFGYLEAIRNQSPLP